MITVFKTFRQKRRVREFWRQKWPRGSRGIIGLAAEAVPHEALREDAETDDLITAETDDLITAETDDLITVGTDQVVVPSSLDLTHYKNFEKRIQMISF